MRVIRIVAVSSFIAGLSLGALPAAAGSPSTLADGGFGITGTTSAPATSNTCAVIGAGSEFFVDGSIVGAGTAGQVITINFDTPQPTSVSRNDNKISVKENNWSTLQAVGGTGGAGIFNSGTQVIQKCDVNGSVNTKKSTGSVNVSCGGSSLFGGITADQAASIQAAFNKAKNIKFKVNSNGKWSLSIKCNGPASGL
jgi:hypothetical protein